MQEHALEFDAGQLAPAASALLSGKSPYFSSPTMAWPWLARCTRIWWVRPVLMVTSSRLKPSKMRSMRTREIERRPSASSLATARTRRSPLGVRYLCRATSTTLVDFGQAPDHQGRVGLAGLTLTELLLQRRQRAALLGQHQQEPEVSRSRRCTNSRNWAWGRARRSCSITPKLTPLPPCTATPAGLFMASR